MKLPPTSARRTRSSFRSAARKSCELLTEEQYNAPHPNPANSYGATYGAHREALEFDAEQHAQLKKWCEEAGIIYSTSVWDLTSAKEITGLHPRFIKIPSACNTHYEMLQWLCGNYEGEIQLSFGMTTREEEEEIVRLFEKNGRAKDLILYNCTSGYPVPFQDVCLLEITRMREQYEGRVKAIGFSGHHLGIVAKGSTAPGSQHQPRVTNACGKTQQTQYALLEDNGKPPDLVGTQVRVIRCRHGQHGNLIW